MPDFLSAKQAAAQLGISMSTLYAYVSRGLLAAHPADDSRQSRYLQSEVDRLVRQRQRGRHPKEAARASLSWGLPVLESGISLIKDGQLYYRGQAATTLAAHASVEDIATLLWQADPAQAFGQYLPATSEIFIQAQHDTAGQRCEYQLLTLFTLASEDAPTGSWQQHPARVAEGCGALLRLMTACLLRQPVSTAPIHEQCASAWGLGPQQAELVRMALVLCADHELNASSFTARCVSSTGASIRAAVIAGLAALTGPKHGGTTLRVEAQWDEWGETAPAEALRQRLARGDNLVGFGHYLYPQGDVRATALLQPILPDHPRWQEVIHSAYELQAAHPTIDFALVALRRHLGLPPGSAFGLFALGRTMGWVAHALEQRQQNKMIRPRAAYSGEPPQAFHHAD